MNDAAIFSLPFWGLKTHKKVKLDDFNLSPEEEKLVIKPDIRLITSQNVYSDFLTNVHNLAHFKRIVSNNEIIHRKSDFPLNAFFK